MRQELESFLPQDDKDEKLFGTPREQERQRRLIVTRYGRTQEARSKREAKAKWLAEMERPVPVKMVVYDEASEREKTLIDVLVQCYGPASHC